VSFGQIAELLSKQRRMTFILCHLIEYCCPGQRLPHTQKANRQTTQR